MKIVTRDGGVKFSRLGPVKFSKQKMWEAAPEPNGLWAFPYPYWEPYLAHHRYDLVLPKRLRLGELDSDASYDDRQEWIKKHGRREMPVRRFFYRGYLYSRISREGEILFDKDWEWVHTSELPKLIRKVRGDRYVEYCNGVRHSIPCSKDHLEVFIARGDGKIFGKL